MDQNQLNSISSYTSKLLRKNFGKGPQSCYTILNKFYLVSYIQGFISPMEEVLMEQGQRNQVELARNVIINHLLEELRGVVQVSLDCEIEESFHDWNLPNNSGMIMFKMSDELESVRSEIKFDFNKFEEEVARISALVQKVPDQINVFPMSSSMVLVERKGILIPIEKALIDKGFGEELRLTKDEFEKRYFHHYGKFDELLPSRVKDIFIDWNFKNDKSLMTFVLD